MLSARIDQQRDVEMYRTTPIRIFQLYDITLVDIYNESLLADIFEAVISYLMCLDMCSPSEPQLITCFQHPSAIVLQLADIQDCRWSRDILQRIANIESR